MNGTGCRATGDATNVPSRIRDVTIAAAVRVGTAANHGPSTRFLQPRWSYVHAWSKPYSSAARHFGSAAHQRSSGRITMPTRTLPDRSGTHRQSLGWGRGHPNVSGTMAGWRDPS